MESLPTPATGSQAGGPAVPLALVDGEPTAEALERMLAAWAVHPAGAGAAHAWLLRAEPRRGGLVLTCEADRPAAPVPLADALSAARRAAPADRGTAWSVPADHAGAPLEDAWAGSRLACAGGEVVPPDAPWSGAGRVGALALRRGALAYGLLVVTWAADRDEAAMRERLEALRLAAGAALDLQARTAELARRARQADALAELARASVSPINVAEALHLVARLAAQGSGARGSAVYRTDAGGAPRAEVTFGPAPLRDEAAQAMLPEVSACLAEGRGRAGADGAAAAGIAGEVGPWALAPLAAYGRTIGAVLVHDSPERPAHEDAFERADATFLAALADHAALLLAHAEALDAAREARREGERAEARGRELSRLVAVSDMASRVAQEARNPLASIAAFARRALREAGPEDAMREYLEIVVRETSRVEGLLEEQRAFAQLQPGRLRMQNLNAVVQDALQQVGETLVRRRVRLLKKLEPSLPELLLDAPRIRRVVENAVTFALESVPVGGRIRVESRRAGGFVAVDVAFDGARARGELLEHLFVPFGAGGAAVGLGVAQQIVQEHGGEVRVRGEGEWGTILTFTLPVAGNEDRRRAAERRQPHADRRRRDAEPGGAEGV